MLCDCSCDVESYNRLENETWRPARKRWACCECGEGIAPGERYQLYTILNEDSVWNKFYTCAPCARIRDDACDCWRFGGLRETLQECLGFDYVTGEEPSTCR